MAGARAAQTWLAAHADGVAVGIVFLPMVPGDDLDSAERAARELFAHDARVACFWDEQRLAGLIWTDQYQSRHFATLLAGLPPDDGLRARLARVRTDPERRAMWDVAWFFARSVRWGEALPEPAAWTKQFGFGRNAAGDACGRFWRSSAPGSVQPSTWTEEFEHGMREVTREDR